MGFEASYAPLDDSVLRERARFDDELWSTECEAFSVGELRQLLVLTRTGRRHARHERLQEFLLPLLEQLEAARSDPVVESELDPELLAWHDAAIELGLAATEQRQRGRETVSGIEELEAQGSGVFAQFFLTRGLLELGADETLAVLRPWELEVSAASDSPEAADACSAFRRGFVSGLSGLRMRLASDWRGLGRLDLDGLQQSVQDLWPSSEDSNASWLVRPAWCPRFETLREEHDVTRSSALSGLAPRLAEALRQNTGFSPKGDASLGLVYACQEMYARDADSAERSLPCRILGPFLPELSRADRTSSWRTRGDAGQWAAHGLLRRLVEDLSKGLAAAAAGGAGVADGGAEDQRRLRLWCTDSVTVSASLSALGFLDALPDQLLPAAAAPAASRLSLAVTSSGAVCAEYNGRPMAVVRSAAEWLARLRAKLDALGPDAEELCKKPNATTGAPRA